MKRCIAMLCVFASSTLPAQIQGATAATGQVNGRVICGDTDLPGRFASVQLIPQKPQQVGIATDLEAMGKNPDFQKAVGVMFGSMIKGSGLSTLAGIDGSFSLDKVPAGTYYVTAQLPGYQSALGLLSDEERIRASEATLKAIEAATQKIEVQPDHAVRADLRLERGSALNGTIRYDDGSPAAGIAPALMLWGKDGKWKEIRSAGAPPVTDDRGRFRFFGLASGKYAVKASLPTVQTSAGLGAESFSMHMNLGDALVVYSGGVLREKDVKPVELGTGDEVDGLDIVFPLSGLHSIAGNVVAKSDNHPINTGWISLLDPESMSAVRATVLDAEGVFHFNYVPDGKYIVKVTGAADTEKREESPFAETDLGRMMNARGQETKAYSDAEQTLLLKSDAIGVTLQVSPPGAKVPPPK